MKPLPPLREADITTEDVFFQRRNVLKALGITAATVSLSPSASADLLSFFSRDKADPAAHAGGLKPRGGRSASTARWRGGEVARWRGGEVARWRGGEVARWRGGEVAKPMMLDIADIFKRFALEERIYRLRCVEAWSMVIPWLGFELNKLLKLAEPTGQARFVTFQTLDDPDKCRERKTVLSAAVCNIRMCRPCGWMNQCILWR